MKFLNHPNIMKLIDIPTKDPYNHRVVLVMEYVEAGSLASQIPFLRKFTERRLWFPMKQMADAFEYLHAQNIVHRKIKLQNVLFNSQRIVKVIDFNMATPFIHGQKFYHHWGTPGYMAPEIIEHGYEGPPVDVWALGILFTKLFDGLQFDGHNIIEDLLYSPLKARNTIRSAEGNSTELVQSLSRLDGREGVVGCPYRNLMMGGTKV
uniref:MAP/microtubule affinity-regulating kinase 4-like n=1 Tax=Myxine glutinosa TaxID=7769 RepID=UPI00358E909A